MEPNSSESCRRYILKNCGKSKSRDVSASEDYVTDFCVQNWLLDHNTFGRHLQKEGERLDLSNPKQIVADFLYRKQKCWTWISGKICNIVSRNEGGDQRPFGVFPDCQINWTDVMSHEIIFVSPVLNFDICQLNFNPDHSDWNLTFSLNNSWWQTDQTQNYMTMTTSLNKT